MAKPATKSGSISAKELYTVREFRNRLGLSAFSLWRARWKGLRTHKVHGHYFILGKDFIEYIETQAERREARRQRRRQGPNYLAIDPAHEVGSLGGEDED